MQFFYNIPDLGRNGRITYNERKKERNNGMGDGRKESIAWRA